MSLIVRLLLAGGAVALGASLWKLFRKPRVFVSFDYENDAHYKRLLEAWDANGRFEFEFTDASSGRIDSEDVGRVKAALTRKIRAATHTLVIVGEEADRLHPQRALIGCRNWINFEIRQSKLAGNKLVGVKLKKRYQSPEELLGSGASWAMSFEEAAIIKALDEA